MPSTDASANATTTPALVTDAGPGTGADPGPGETPGTDCEDTLDLRLPAEFLALIADEAAAGVERSGAERRAQTGAGGRNRDDLLDGVAGWGPVATSVGVFQLVPVHAERDLPLIGRWMNDPTVAEFWGLAGPQNRTEEHVRSQLSGDGRSVPCLGMLDGMPMSYWEIYRADLDPVARHYPARPHDTGIHLLIGAPADRGRGLGSALLRAVADLALDKRPACARVIAEPDLRNTSSVSAFLSAGFRFSAEIDLPGKRAAFMVRDRSRRDLL
ncbi:N-acetyltransferase [Streptomyces sp. Act143]|uniref:GNAT family N-acetyltransferase n=1 Tax=Streptomyces sp. Act143 TaxID=2200760 RepID=UPI000D67F584|nr:GNAT family N-acetyltransferase [Streptomyces sp. Act143]PWI15039.1 N-acetyltransferase [Streptomyces sp. Act143]